MDSSFETFQFELFFSVFSRFTQTVWPICIPEKPQNDKDAYEDFGLILTGMAKWVVKFAKKG